MKTVTWISVALLAAGLGQGADAFSIHQVTFDTKITDKHWAVNGSPVPAGFYFAGFVGAPAHALGHLLNAGSVPGKMGS